MVRELVPAQDLTSSELRLCSQIFADFADRATLRGADRRSLTNDLNVDNQTLLGLHIKAFLGPQRYEAVEHLVRRFADRCAEPKLLQIINCYGSVAPHDDSPFCQEHQVSHCLVVAVSMSPLPGVKGVDRSDGYLYREGLGFAQFEEGQGAVIDARKEHAFLSSHFAQILGIWF